MVEKSIYLFMGEDGVSKDRKIAALKKENLPENSLQFNYELLYADSLEPSKLKELLYCLPVNSRKRLVVIKEADKLSSQNKEILLSFVKNPPKDTLLVLDTNKSGIKDDLFKDLSRYAEIFNFTKPALNVFDLGRSVAHKKSKEALLCLSRLLENGEKQGNILGVIGWQWRKLRQAMPEKEFIRGLELLQEADLNIKRSRLKGNLALELLVVKLCEPVSC